MRSSKQYMILGRGGDGIFRCVFGPCTRQGCKYWKERHPNERVILVELKPVW